MDRSQRVSLPGTGTWDLGPCNLFLVLWPGLACQTKKCIFACDLYLRIRISYWLLFICSLRSLIEFEFALCLGQDTAEATQGSGSGKVEAEAKAKAFNELQENSATPWQGRQLLANFCSPFLATSFFLGVCRESFVIQGEWGGD